MRNPLILAVALIVVLAGCGQSSGEQGSNSSNSENFATGATFTMAIPTDMGGFDPYHVNISAYSKLAYDSLVHLSPDGEYVSGLAETWSADATSASFVLRPDVTCSDGQPLTASDVAAAIDYVKDANNQSVLYGLMVPTEPFTVTADDASRSVQIAMDEPFGFLLSTVGMLPIVCPEGLKNPTALSTTSNGSGPFVLTNVVPGQSYTFTVREGYEWGPDGASTSAPGTPAEIVLQVVGNETTAANLMLSGQVNFVKLTGQDEKRLEAQGLQKIEVPAAGPLLSFNQIGDRATADVRVRRALISALDLAEIVKVNTGGTGRASTGLIAMEPKACSDDTVSGHLPAYDTDAAERLLDEAGWTRGADGIRRNDGEVLDIELHYRASSPALDKATAELLAQRWTAIGVQAKVVSDADAAWSDVLWTTSNWDAALIGWGLYLPSQALPFVTGPTPPNGQNYAGIQNNEYAALAAQAIANTPPEACEFWAQAEHALWAELNPVPLADRPWSYFLKGATVQTAGFDLPIPTSIRMLK